MKCLAILAASGLASAAIGQSDGWILGFDKTELSPLQPTVLITLSATFPRADYAFAGARLSVSASEPGWGFFELIWPSGPGQSRGVVTGSDVTGIIMGQVHFPPPILADPTNPRPMWRGEFTVTDFRQRTIDFSTRTTDFRVYPDISSAASRAGIPIEGVGGIRVIPAPAGVALLALGGVAAARRRR